ncbi:MAG: hypothetical protein ABW034_25575 [Steroidobacteraceae bacterium]
MTNSSLIARIARALGAADALEALESRLSPTDLQSLLLHVFARRTAQRGEAELFGQYERSAMVRPGAVGARELLQLEQAAYDSAPQFEAIELSPVAPLGLNTVLGQIHQNNCLATVRGVEVLADPTTVAALECARRRRAGQRDDIRLCSRARMLRLQPLAIPEFSPHFGLFSWVTAGRDRGDYRFELDSVLEHLDCHLDLLRRVAALGYQVGEIAVKVSHTQRDERRLAQVQQDVFAPLVERYPAVAFALDREREQARNYYSGLCLHINVKTASGWFNLSDGGLATWTQRLLSNCKERLMVSAMGIELIPKVLKRAAAPRPSE